jgi:hypothetical protein
MHDLLMVLGALLSVAVVVYTLYHGLKVAKRGSKRLRPMNTTHSREGILDLGPTRERGQHRRQEKAPHAVVPSAAGLPCHQNALGAS